MAGKTKIFERIKSLFKIRLSFKTRLLILVLGTAWVFVITFFFWQYEREKQFKAEILDTQLQMHNLRIINDMARGEDIGAVVSRINPPMPDVRVTLIDDMGRVTFDTNDAMGIGNHADRPEVIAARKNGWGMTVSRKSQIDGKDYFYTATRGPYGLIVRTAVPYDHSLLDTLSADWQFLWAIIAASLVISIIGWMATDRLSRSIKRLSSFAATIEKGQRMPEGYKFPKDELGTISSHIITLYNKWMQTMEERDLQHAEALKAEREKERFKKQLTIDINHELKTPVASIILCLETLKDFPDLPPVRREEMENRILTNALRLQNMLKDVSLITRMDEGSDMIHFTPVSLNELVTEVADDLRPSAAKKGIEIVVDMPRTPQMIDGNAPMLESIFRNLIRNAILYCGGTEIKITGDEQGNWTVGDDGIGIAEEHYPHIFDRFYRLDKGRSRKVGGTGLGLAIVKTAVELHGGKIAISSNDPGTLFSFNFPNQTAALQ
ncbi:MAG: sensor histidine kinase [Muribaculaceae bacterium]|nr:sensor histidine kinase [Bacteroidales bacterium]MDE6243068.1 sensor histidine kinase [Muribaculaceae bacterium]